ncbi:MAG: Fumarylacetoacetate hydrolase family protein, partial [uncultured Phycisphaerae bacterium]
EALQDGRRPRGRGGRAVLRAAAGRLGRPGQPRRPAGGAGRRGADERARARRVGRPPARRAAAGGVAGGLGRGRHVPAQQGRADGGVQGRGRRRLLRQGLRRRPAGAVLQVDAEQGGRPRAVRAGQKGLALERPRARAGAAGQRARRDRRVHDRQRHELARHRGREPALPAAGQGVRRRLRARPMPADRPRPAAPRDRDPHRDHPRRCDRVRGRDVARPDETATARARRMAPPRPQLPDRRDPPHRHRRRPAGRVLAALGRRDRDHDRPDRDVAERGGI